MLVHWHCNQNQYAGYRRQFRNATLGEIEQEGDTVAFILKRSSVLAVNDDTPLTLVLSGITRHAIKSIECPDCKVTMSDRDDDDRVRFHVPHQCKDRLPKRIGHVANPENMSKFDQLKRDRDFPQLIGGLVAQGQSLSLSLQADEQHALEDIRVVWRVPNRSRALCRTNRLSSERRTQTAPLYLPASGNGAGFIVASRGLQHLGPIDPAKVKSDDLQDLAMTEWTKQRWSGEQWRLPDGTDMKWRRNGRDGYVKQEWLNPEYVRTMGTWDALSKTYVLRSTIHSPNKRAARLAISHEKLSDVWINGQEVKSNDFELSQGENKILIVYPGCTLGVATQRLTACFVRLFDPNSGMRMRDIRYQAF